MVGEDSDHQHAALDPVCEWLGATVVTRDSASGEGEIPVESGFDVATYKSSNLGTSGITSRHVIFPKGGWSHSACDHDTQA